MQFSELETIVKSGEDSKHQFKDDRDGNLFVARVWRNEVWKKT